MRRIIPWIALHVFLYAISSAAGDVFINDFEAEDHGEWQVSGEAFGQEPVTGALPGQPAVRGWENGRFINSFHGGEAAKGVLTSPEFVIERDFINFQIGGGHHRGSRRTRAPRDFWGDECCVNLLIKPVGLPLTFDHIHTGHHRLAVGDRIVLRTTTGPGLSPAGNVELQWETWDVRSLRGQTARIQVVDNHSGSEGFICVDQIAQSDQPQRDIYTRADILHRANENVQRAEKKAPSRRGYHYTPAVFGFGGPTCVYHDGYYHLFYIYDPFWDRKDVWNHNFWRHARSKDLVYWEDMSVVIWPSEDNGEFYCASGAAVIGDDGTPWIFYTSRSSERPMDQMAAVGDATFEKWRKVATNPVITNTPDNPMAMRINGTGTDCSVFKHEGRWYMVLGGKIKVDGETKGCFTLHGSDDLMNWEFVGLPYVAETKGWEEPEMFKLGDKWVVIFEPFGPTQYYTGTFDWENVTFTPEVHSFVDFVGSEKHDPKTHGHAEYSGSFYGCTPFEDKDGRMIYMGMAPGGQSLPRVLTIRPDGKLAQRPIEALAKLRGEHYAETDVDLVDTSHVIRGIEGNMLEVKVEFVPGSAQEFGLKLRRSADGSQYVPIRYDGERLEVSGERIPADLMEGESTLRLHVFIDQHIIEVFANDWVVYTVRVSAPATDLGIELFSAGGSAKVKRLDIWKLDSIW